MSPRPQAAGRWLAALAAIVLVQSGCTQPDTKPDAVDPISQDTHDDPVQDTGDDDPVADEDARE